MAAIIGSEDTDRLRVIRQPEDACELGVDIVLVPGTGSSPLENWPFANADWLSRLPTPGANARILTYQFASPFAGNKPVWESILMQGYDFLQQLSETRLSSIVDSKLGAEPPLKPLDQRPIIIVCHSLGGIVVKQALCVANKQSARYSHIVNVVAGVVFLSTPHRYGDEAASLVGFRDVLEATTGKSLKILSSNIEREGAILIDLADRFEGISLRTPILSIYELRESRIGTSLRPKYQLLVDREACSTHAPLETVVGLNLNHDDTCLFTKSIGGEGLNCFDHFVQETLLGAGHLVAIRLEDEEYQYATTSAYSPTASELPLKVEHLKIETEMPSNRATDGTSSSGFEQVYPSTPELEVKHLVNLPCHVLNTHAANEDFCGREDILEQIGAELLPSKTTATSSGTTLKQFALCGFGGIGKTEIAREFAQKHKDSFDAVFWVLADEISKLNEQYQQISLALGLEDPTECGSQVVSREIVKGWLSNPRKDLSTRDELAHSGKNASEATWLLIFDNADDPMILADYWPQGSGSILITSRDPLAKSIFTRRSLGYDLGPLTQQDSLSLLNHLTAVEDESEEETARQIVNALGGVPLAISQMAGIIRRQDLTLAEFYELYNDHEEHANLYDTNLDTNLVPYRHSLSTVWAIEKLKQRGQQLLDLICFLDPDVVTEDLFLDAATSVLSDGSAFKKSQYLEARADLLQSSLIQRNKQKQLLTVHRIVQDVILAKMVPEKKRSLFDCVVTVLWSNWPSAMPKPSKEPILPQPKSSGGRLHVGRWPACVALYPHVLRMHQIWSTVVEPSDATSLQFAKLLLEAAQYQTERGRTQGFDGFFETAMSICEASSHADRDSVLADVHFCLGANYMDSSNFEKSRGHKERSLALCVGICQDLGKADERLYLAYAEMGISRIQDERYAEGEADLKEALRIRKALGNYVPRAGEATLSYALMAQGKLTECDTLLLESLAGREKALGKNDRESARTGLILYALGNLRALQMHWDESFRYHERAWEHMRATVGERDLKTARTSYKLAQHLNRIGKNEEAIAMTNKALDIWSVDPNAYKADIARTTFLKGKLFESTGKSQKASIAFRVAHRLRKEITKEDRDAKTLTTKDFDGIVSFWAR